MTLLPYPPPYQDIKTLCAHLCIEESMVKVLTARGLLPPPVMLAGSELRWEWSDIKKRLGGRVYFIEGGQFIKIGFSGALRKRLKTLQKSSPVPLKVLCSIKGGRLREAAFHETFAHLRAHGEWFRAAPEIYEYIAILKKRPLEADENGGEVLPWFK